VNKKKRILIPITGQGAVTHIVRTGILQKISTDVHPIIILYWKDDVLKSELENLGAEVHLMRFVELSAQYKSLYYKINLWYLNKVLNFNGIKIEDKLHKTYRFSNKKIIKTIRYWYNLILVNFPVYVNHLLHKEKEIFLQEKLFKEYTTWLSSLHIDGLFTVTPFLQEINLIARILQLKNKPILASVHSFDNVTKRGWQPTVFDEYIVWNEYNKKELLSIHKKLNQHQIHIAGAPQFDFHYNNIFLLPKEQWLQIIGLPANKKIILYAGGAASLFPTEPQYAKHVTEAIDNGIIDNNVVVLVRNHPLDTVQRWKEMIGESTNVFFYEPQHGKQKLDYTNVDDFAIKMLISTLYYTDIHINLCSTMTVDGSVFNKPQIAPYYDDMNKAGEAALRNIYYQEHYKPILNSGVLQFANSKQSLITLINNNLANSSYYTNNCKKCVEEIITYTDGKSGERVVEIFQNFFR
jgi:CDP-glycerol glycerophosphotransferase (TagB/SpsB family)